MLRKILICAGFVIVVLLTSCSNRQTDALPVDSEPERNEPEKPTYSESAISKESDTRLLSSQIRNSERWEDVNWILSMLGKSAQEVMDAQISSYFHYTDGSEIFLVDNSAYLCFSDEVWASGSRCVLIGIPPTWLAGKPGFDGDVKISDVETKTGVAPKNYNQEYFCYRFEDMEIRIFTKADGETLYEDSDIEHYTMILAPDTEPIAVIAVDAEARVVNKKDVRIGLEWEKTNGYISQMGKASHEIETILECALEVYDSADGNYCIDTGTHVGYRFDASGFCEWLWGPSDLLLPYENGMMTKDALLSYWKDVNYMRCSYEEYSYIFDFEDVSITIFETTREGNLTDRSIMDIKCK
jgi:hypothetical protein